ncbi:MAG TPA: hypothetical protein VJ789_13070 [Burkholderiales bacterium]|nr:hypothetical protein [Burkholderiales bacterium]
MSASFIVRAQVVDASVKEAFDRWYQSEHLPDAVKAFGARRAWRGWSEADPSVHYAVYEFDDLARLRALPGSAALKGLVAEFDRAWGDKVVRTREGVRVVQQIET